MSSEQRLDRIERILKLMASAGLRARRSGHEQDDKINLIIDYQIKNEERFQQNEERFARLAEAQTRLADSQTHSDQKLDALIDIVRNGPYRRFST
jgi:hypothetical protein